MPLASNAGFSLYKNAAPSINGAATFLLIHNILDPYSLFQQNDCNRTFNPVRNVHQGENHENIPSGEAAAQECDWHADRPDENTVK